VGNPVISGEASGLLKNCENMERIIISFCPDPIKPPPPPGGGDPPKKKMNPSKPKK